MLKSLIALTILVSASLPAAADDALYHWQPVRLGAGGLVTGFVTHPLDAKVRYCRTDVGNAYRWDGSEWRPMLVFVEDKGVPADLAAAPAVCGVESVSVDPHDAKVVYLTFHADRGGTLSKLYPALSGGIYKSTDGGLTFTASDFPITMEANGPWRGNGERLAVDPLNSDVLYYGSVKQGVHRSIDGGKTWKPVAGSGPKADANVLTIDCVAKDGSIQRDGIPVCKTLYATVANGSVFHSGDGGAAWDNLSARHKLDGPCERSRLAPDGTLWLIAAGKDVPNLWHYRDGTWTGSQVNMWGGLHDIAFHPHDPLKLVGISNSGAYIYSTDGGLRWTAAGNDPTFANTLGWLPQPPGYRGNTGIQFDRDGELWMSMGNEGMLRYVPTFSETQTSLPRWQIDSVGIEEFVTHDVILPPGGDAIFAVEDATGLVSADLAKFVARHIPLQDQLISNGSGLAYCPNAPKFVAVVTADVNHTGSGKSYSGFSPDGGKSWTRFAGLPIDSAGQAVQSAGSIAISRRDGWSTGADHLVWLPVGVGPTHWSHDGGRTWHASEGFPLKSGYWTFSLKQRLLAADPHVPDKFYFVGTWAGGFYVSIDGGKTWKKQERAALPAFNHHAQLATNRAVKDDLWFVDGWDGASQHGLWHSTTGGDAFTKIAGIDYAITLCTGAPRGNPGDAPFTVYFYGLLTGDKAWGIFRSCNAGKTWQRVSFYPAGLFDQPTCMAASWDTFGKVIVGFTGNSFAVGLADRAEK